MFNFWYMSIPCTLQNQAAVAALEMVSVLMLKWYFSSLQKLAHPSSFLKNIRSFNEGVLRKWLWLKMICWPFGFCKLVKISKQPAKPFLAEAMQSTWNVWWPFGGMNWPQLLFFFEIWCQSDWWPQPIWKTLSIRNCVWHRSVLRMWKPEPVVALSLSLASQL